MGEPWKHYAKWKKSDAEDHTYYTIPLIWKAQNRQIHRQKVDEWLSKARGRREWEEFAIIHEISFWGDTNVLELDSGIGCTTYEYTKTHWIEYFEIMNLWITPQFLETVFSNRLLLLYKNTIMFHLLTLYPVILLNSVILLFLRIFYDIIMTFANKESFTFFFSPHLTVFGWTTSMLLRMMCLRVWK